MSETLELLEWPRLFEHLLAQCQTPYGVKCWQAKPFLGEPEAIQQHLAEVDAFKILLIRYGDGGINPMPDITSAVKRLAKGGSLNLDEIRQIMQTLQQGSKLFRHFHRNLKGDTLHLARVLAPLLDEELLPQTVTDSLSQYLDHDGELKDSASPALGGLRQKLRHQRQALHQQTQHYLRHPDYASALQSTVATEREGRTVLAIKSEYKNKIPGVLHGSSTSGSTVFLEPNSLVSANNQLQAAYADLQAEIERLVREISSFLEAHHESLERFIIALGEVDKRLSAARLSTQMQANPIEVSRQPQIIELKQARHPLLVLQKTAVVANDIQLGQDNTRTLVITGPNTGGKTVILKTVGLLALMLKAGLHLPVETPSQLSLFDPILADIGDQQSITQNLSTFSAHVEQLKQFVADETQLHQALVLIDEIAAGTDPAEGAALAKAILEELHQKGALTLVSTHLGELKVEAHQHAGFMNASVEFNPETLKPTYRLLLGVPGSSNAITIAQMLGLKPVVIDRAKRALSAPVRESSQLIEELETKNRQLDEELQRARSYRLEAQESFEKVEWERQQLEAEKRQILKQFQSSLKGRLHSLEDQVKDLRKQVHQGTVKDPDRTAQKLKIAGKKADAVFSEMQEQVAKSQVLTITELKMGDTVFSKQLEITGEITALLPTSKEVTLQSGLLRVTVPVSDLQKPYTGPQKRQQKQPSIPKAPEIKSNARPTVLSEAREVDLVCDVRGQRAEEALDAVEKFLDDATLNGLSTVAIVHGLGTGALKKQIRQALGNSPYVSKFYPAEATQGGDGKTIVELSADSSVY